MNNEEALMKVVVMLAKEGISTNLTHGDHGLVAWFEDGFYKSDGMARLQVDGDRLVLHARYEEKTQINGLEDIVQCSKSWHEYSHDKFDGWREPPAHWARLYEKVTV